jgi:lipoyl-dependent peroxiredoxin
MIRTIIAQWNGNIIDGKETMSIQKGILEQMTKPIESKKEPDRNMINPEELLTDVHAKCFTMSVLFFLNNNGLFPDTLDTTATLTFEGFSIKAIHLMVEGLGSGITMEEYIYAAKAAERNCIICKANNVAITSEVKTRSSGGKTR